VALKQVDKKRRKDKSNASFLGLKTYRSSVLASLTDASVLGSQNVWFF
jgi:hypothetical protein